MTSAVVPATKMSTAPAMMPMPDAPMTPAFRAAVSAVAEAAVAVPLAAAAAYATGERLVTKPASGKTADTKALPTAVDNITPGSVAPSAAPVATAKATPPRPIPSAMSCAVSV